MYLKISRQRLTGARELRKRVRPDGAAPFLHRKAGVRELPQACSPLTGRLFFLHRKAGVRELPQACSPFPGGKFSAEPQRTAGTCRAPRRGKRVDTKVSTLLTPTSFYFLVWRRPETGDRFENRERQRIFSSVSFATCSQGQIHYCYTCS